MFSNFNIRGSNLRNVINILLKTEASNLRNQGVNKKRNWGVKPNGICTNKSQTFPKTLLIKCNH